MTEALQKDYEKTCAERIDEQWKLRVEDLKILSLKDSDSTT